MADEGRLLVDTAYLQKYLVDFGNEKMEANWARTARLHHLFKDQLLSQQVKMGAVAVHTLYPSVVTTLLQW